ncbi:unnamed protein product [Acanthoscelides obtectus]|uniref:Uncharacterized protein n=1 Tax=Acanthoscelides obtectus TaxID=200917 RepID=A0A9P0NZH7_ACAOB|nr:unnamed protein product [Acanthoscelides obtectus]CAK1647985.1 hypothetical protein AOBTE_LOCUS15488 [Acanthoscelides obtectus]
MEISSIRREIRSVLSVEQFNIDIEYTAGTESQSPTAELIDVDTLFISNLRLYENMDISIRPRLPKLIEKGQSRKLMGQVNDYLNKHLQNEEDFTEIHTSVYVAAATVLTLNDQTIHVNTLNAFNRLEN